MNIRTCIASAMAFAAYVIFSVIGSVIIVGIWVRDPALATLSQIEINQLANTDSTVWLYTSLLSLALSALITIWLTRRIGKVNPVLVIIGFVVLLTLYGGLSILLHPEHTLWQQTTKLLTPSLWCYLIYKLTPKRKVSK